MACQSIQGVTPTKGWNVNVLCFLFRSFFSAARGQTALPIFDELYLKMHVSATVDDDLYMWTRPVSFEDNYIPEMNFLCGGFRKLLYQYRQM